MTGPASYGSLNVPFVIHAVGPDFNDYTLETLDEQHMAYSLLRSAYQTSLDLASAFDGGTITDVAFCLLSAGVYRGEEALDRIVHCGLSAISEWRSAAMSTTAVAAMPQPSHRHRTTTLQNIPIFAYTEQECDVLMNYGRRCLVCKVISVFTLYIFRLSVCTPASQDR